MDRKIGNFLISFGALPCPLNKSRIWPDEPAAGGRRQITNERDHGGRPGRYPGVVRTGSAAGDDDRMALGNLSAGASGPEVKAVQQGLNIRGAGPTLKEDGIFGRRTEHAVRHYQSRHGLNVDGIVGAETRRSLFWIGVATVTVIGRRDPKVTYLWPQRAPALPDRPASLAPGQSQRPDFEDLNTTICSGLSATSIRPRHIWPLTLPVPMPAMPEWNFTIEPLRPAAPAKPFGFVYDHVELQPGEESAFPIGSHRQDAFVLTMQSIYRRGPDDGPHLQAPPGVQIGAPFVNGAWTINPFVQITDVDRLGALGAFHCWQPYAQIGFQTSGPDVPPQPAAAGSLFPVNLTLNIVKDVFLLGFGASVALSLDLHSGRIQAAPQLSFGLTVELGRPDGSL
jgi:Putative peptidoglycan binding domain